MSGRNDRPAGESSDRGPHEKVARHAADGGDAGSVGALDGVAAAGGRGAVSDGKRGSLIPEEAPDPSIGPD
ncbi:hypothetical protein FHU33_0562 [Blastococcus colisei]|uniref:Uncharacterized protein n=1 Tax=Blastococcus colisei TaxID=1564162 RepID=A0A543PAU4_9ACTN|nr:hypothetical protein [Blastococcus colisei]TQN41202.1 hypothetical protein FHU33_0562 [Blastococcus colisei]